MSTGKVGFLMEIMKSKTSTRQQPQERTETMMEPPCADRGVSDCDTEVREQPPKMSPKKSHHSHKFDYYGNPINEQEQHLQRLFQQQLHFQTQAAAAAAAAPKAAAYSQPQPPVQQMKREDYSEFLVADTPKAVGPNNTPQQQQYRKDMEEMPRGCIAEFGHCMQVTLCCADDEVLVNTAVDTAVDTPRTLSHDMMQEINDELQALRRSTMDAKTTKAVLEFELRAELTDIRRQKAEMEESYRREIARENSEKVVLQALLQSKLLSMMEERMLAEIQLDRLNGKNNVPRLTQGRSSSPAESSNSSIPTAKCMPVTSNQPADPPIDDCVTPMDPSAMKSIVLSCTPKSAQSRNGFNRMPSGLSVVVESPDGHSDRPEGPATLMSPTANRSRSFSPTTATRSPPVSPPASNRSCEPEGVSFEEATAAQTPSSSNSKSPTAFGEMKVMTPSSSNRRSPTAYNSLPLPVATPVHVQGFAESE